LNYPFDLDFVLIQVPKYYFYIHTASKKDLYHIQCNFLVTCRFGCTRMYCDTEWQEAEKKARVGGRRVCLDDGGTVVRLVVHMMCKLPMPMMHAGHGDDGAVIVVVVPCGVYDVPSRGVGRQ